MYSKPDWLEHSLSAAQKLTALDNLESMYSEAISYIDAIAHSSSYYTDAQCDSKFFKASNDGSGTGLICATLDGLTAQQIIDSGIPSGAICWWSGSEASIPAGFSLCDGTNGTPNLQDRFVVGAGGNYAKGATGGANIVTTTATITVAGHSLTAAEMPKHTHGTITDYYPGGWSSAVDPGGYTLDQARSYSEVSRDTGSTGSGDAHSHGATFDGTDDQIKMPPYYALCAIMKD